MPRPVTRRSVFRTQWIRGAHAHAHALQGLLKMAAQRGWIAELHQATQRTFAIWRRSESPPSAHRYHFPIGSTDSRGGQPRCTRNPVQFVESRREPASATARGGFPGNRRGSASAFLAFTRACGTPESPAAIAALPSWGPKIGGPLLSAGERFPLREPQMREARLEECVR
jgi:hypothetical protein